MSTLVIERLRAEFLFGCESHITKQKDIVVISYDKGSFILNKRKLFK